MKKHITTVNKAMLNKTLRTGGCGECQEITEHNQKRRLRRVPDILPVCMQNFLHCRQPGL